MLSPTSVVEIVQKETAADQRLREAKEAADQRLAEVNRHSGAPGDVGEDPPGD